MMRENIRLLLEEQNTVAREAEATKKASEDIQEAFTNFWLYIIVKKHVILKCIIPLHKCIVPIPKCIIPFPKCLLQVFTPGPSENVGYDGGGEYANGGGNGGD